jgi:glycosyltransferase involved in cell wall biosynthesis
MGDIYMKKVLFIGMTGNYGGLETFMINIFRKLNGDNFQFDFIKENPNEKLAYEDEILSHGGNIYCVPIENSVMDSGFSKYITILKLVNDFFENHHDYDIVHLNCLYINRIFWIKKAYNYGIKKLIVHSHIDKSIVNSSKVKVMISKILTKINQNYVNRNNSIIKLSASKRAGKYLFNSDDFQIINNGIDVDKYKYTLSKKQSIRHSLNISDGMKVIMTVARIDTQKNYPKIINIFKKLHDEQDNTCLVIIGNGPDYNQIVSMVQNYGLTNSVLFLGIRKDVNKLLSAADLILMPSLVEAFPFALVESQAAGVPGIVSKDVIPLDENITGRLTYVPLDNSDEIWKNVVIDTLKAGMTPDERICMYNDVRNSVFNLDNSINEIKRIYSK